MFVDGRQFTFPEEKNTTGSNIICTYQATCVSQEHWRHPCATHVVERHTGVTRARHTWASDTVKHFYPRMNIPLPWQRGPTAGYPGNGGPTAGYPGNGGPTAGLI